MLDAVIPVKLHSKRCKNKNTREFFNEMSLLNLKLDQLSKCDFVRRIWISIDDEKLEDLIDLEDSKIGVVLRPKSLCYDTVEMNLIYTHLASLSELDDVLYTSVTTPFINTTIFELAYKEYLELNCIALHSVSKITDFIVDLRFNPMNFDKGKFPRSQDLKHYYKMVYGFAFLKKTAMLTGTTFPENTIPFEIRGNGTIDIDTEEDFSYAQFLMTRLKNV